MLIVKEEFNKSLIEILETEVTQNSHSERSEESNYANIIVF